MKIKKILNNNAVIAEKEDLTEVIVMGKGLAFKAKTGQDIDPAKIDKTFILTEQEQNTHFARLLSEMNLDEFEFADRLITQAKMELGKNLSNVIYVTLTDHINTCKERAACDSYITNSMLWDVKRLYKDEFKAAQEMVRQMNVRFGARFDDHEAASIAIHLVNAQTDIGLNTVVKMTKLMNEVVNIIKYAHGVVFDEDSLAWFRFITHLQFFAQRLLAGNVFPDEHDGLLDMIVGKYPDYYQTTLKIQQFIQNKYGYQMTNEEAMYLTIHIAKVVRASKSDGDIQLAKP